MRLSGSESWRIGRQVKPFSLESIVLPVLDDQVRQVRYLAPRRVCDGPGWRDILRPSITALGT